MSYRHKTPRTFQEYSLDDYLERAVSKDCSIDRYEAMERIESEYGWIGTHNKHKSNSRWCQIKEGDK